MCPGAVTTLWVGAVIRHCLHRIQDRTVLAHPSNEVMRAKVDDIFVNELFKVRGYVITHQLQRDKMLWGWIADYCGDKAMVMQISSLMVEHFHSLVVYRWL